MAVRTTRPSRCCSTHPASAAAPFVFCSPMCPQYRGSQQSTSMYLQAASAMYLSFLLYAPASIGHLAKWWWGHQIMLYMLWMCKAARGDAHCTQRLLVILNGSQHVSTCQMVASFLAAWTACCACGRQTATVVSS